MTEIQQKIIQSAEQCFFQYGYSKTNMSLVSEYAGISRVTIHKHFKNKEGLFRSVIEECISQSINEAKQLINDEPSEDCWYNIERYMLVKTKSVFDNVTDTFILKDLHNTANDIAYDLLEEKKSRSAYFIAQELHEAEQKDLIDLSKVELSPEEIGELIMHSFSGLFMYSEIENIKNQLIKLIQVFKAATIKLK